MKFRGGGLWKVWYWVWMSQAFGICGFCVIASETQFDAAIQRFRDYLMIETVHPNPNYGPVKEFLLAQAKDIGLKVRVLEYVKDKPVVLLSWEGEDRSLPSVLFNSHTDVVAAESSKWKYPPFSAYVDEVGNIYARGSQDMKCVGMQYLEAVRNMKKSGFKPLRSIHISFVPDEEIGGHDGAGLFVDSGEFRDLKVGMVMDEGLASPEDSYRVFRGERVAWWFVVKAVGKPGHGSRLYENSALDNLRIVMNRFSKFREAQFDLVKNGSVPEGEVVSINNVYLKAGSPSPTGFVMNVQPSEAEAGFDMRLPPWVDVNAIESLFDQEWADAHNITYSVRNNLSVIEFVQQGNMQNKFGEPAVSVTDDSNPWWTLFKGAVEKAGGKLSQPEIFPASTDARYVRYEGIPAFGFSPMANTPILLHEHNEILNSAEYIKGVKVYEEILNAYSSFTGSIDGIFETTSESVHTEL